MQKILIYLLILALGFLMGISFHVSVRDLQKEKDLEDLLNSTQEPNQSDRTRLDSIFKALSSNPDHPLPYEILGGYLSNECRLRSFPVRIMEKGYAAAKARGADGMSKILRTENRIFQQRNPLILNAECPDARSPSTKTMSKPR